MKVFILWSLFVFSNASNDRQLVSEYTCSFDFATCGGDAWCDTSSDTCDLCKGEYVLIEELDKRTCIPRWHGCNDHPDDGSQPDPCCGVSECVDYNEYSKGCEVHYSCCSSNQFHCKLKIDIEYTIMTVDGTVGGRADLLTASHDIFSSRSSRW